MDGNQAMSSKASSVINRCMFRQIEDLLYEHPAVDEVAVLNILDQEGQEFLAAFIVPRTEQLTEAEILAFISQNNQLENTPLLRAVKLVARIPKTPSGKVLRNQLLEQMANA